MTKAKWSTDPRQVAYSVGTDGTFSFAAPLLDNGVKQGTLTITMTADRVLEFIWKAEPGVVGLSGFTAWSTE